MELNVVTLNCWGLPFGVSKHRSERMQHIAKELASGAYDIVSLQEIWVMEDYQLIKSTVEKVLPHSFYFRMGMLHGGLCIFSKWPIIDTFYHPYSLNGYAHKVTMADWYISKMVALCKLDVEGMTVNVYNTHAHALYAPSNIPEKDEFLTHRLTQLYELSEFVRLTSGAADLVLVTGDFNSEPFSLATKLAVSNARLLDAWETRENKEYTDGMTNERLGNPLAEGQTLFYMNTDNGERIDYIFYQSFGPYTAKCLKTTLALQKIPGMDLHYSDHEGVLSTIYVTLAKDTQGRGDDVSDENSNQEEDGSPWQHLPDHLKEAILHLSSNIEKVKSDQKWCLVRALFFFTLLLLSLSLGSVSQVLAFVWTCGMTLLTAFYLGFGIVAKECEKKTLTGIMEGMKVRLSVVENRTTVNGEPGGKHI
ncbi:putative neutral sphingomyelinase [Strongylocentrotus purpuratus]|uniref:sphingomyelin phosphodiesterase n=1 Tax=Strongylocentrotus purpuratus TaxID=7668 RepID=A0A7M7RGU8_STRPU|nr:putative neutral sphingomyelinase [Strongylocentrotus purpuratus]|eukprot:XP_011682389.1 PREDICTED: putative neutral sphingomyelinase isoform X3 [Strongylocentrotus purpuratus]